MAKKKNESEKGNAGIHHSKPQESLIRSAIHENGRPVLSGKTNGYSGKNNEAVLSQQAFEQVQKQLNRAEQLIPCGPVAHGVFQLYDSVGKYTNARFLNDTSITTPVFVRFNNATCLNKKPRKRDACGFSVKFYTEDGVLDVPGSNVPVFYIQSLQKFPELVSALNAAAPENAAFSESFWDFIDANPEALHMLMWIMSDRALPRSYRMMEGYGTNVFVLRNKIDEIFYAKFFWKPMLGSHSMTWDEIQKISVKDPDFYRRDLWESIDNGNYPEWELGMQVISEKDTHWLKAGFCDPTLFVPEEELPLHIIGKMTLNRNPDSFFAGTGQFFHSGRSIPGIDFNEDTILQSRLFLHGELHTLQPNNTLMRENPSGFTIYKSESNSAVIIDRMPGDKGKSNTHNGADALYRHSETSLMRVDLERIIENERRFFNSQGKAEKKHLFEAFAMEWIHLTGNRCRSLVNKLLAIDAMFAARVAYRLGLEIPKEILQVADKPVKEDRVNEIHPALYNQWNISGKTANTIRSRRIAILAADGVNGFVLSNMKAALEIAGATTKIISVKQGKIKDVRGREFTTDETFKTASSLFFDAVYIPGGAKSAMALRSDKTCLAFINEACSHFKPVAADGEGVDLVSFTSIGPKVMSDGQAFRKNINDGVIINGNTKDFINAIARHRFWNRGTGSGFAD